jgi:hypothetical protein
MNRLLSGIAIAAALALSAPVLAQQGGNAMGMPGPNAGGGGLTPYSTGAAPPAATSAQPPMNRPARHHATHANAMHHGPSSATDTTAQLNRDELARLQAGAPPPPPTPTPAPPMQGGNSMGMPGPSTGGPGLTPYSTGPQAPR